MYLVIHLLFFFFLFCQNEKGLLNFVSERIIFLKLVYKLTILGTAFTNISCLFNLLKPHFIGRILSN